MNKYYDCKIKERRECRRIDDYLSAIDAISKKHGFSIVFQIENESFAIRDYNEDDAKYLSCANIDVECANAQST